MLTDEQMEKARKALQNRKAADMKRRIMLRMYREDQERARMWLLPFRMVHRAEYPPDEIVPNDYYPRPCEIAVDGSGTPVPIPDARKITPETAEYYFTRLLAENPYLMEYADSDWTGEAISAAEVAGIREAYMKRIRDYKEHPEKYDTQKHLKGTGGRYFLPPNDI